MPKQSSFDFVVDGSPESVAERLRGRTRARAVPSHRPTHGTGGLGGTVSAASFTVALDRTRPWSGRFQPVASGTFEAEGVGRTRVRGTCGVPGPLVWYLRALWLAVAALVVVTSGLAVGGDTSLLPFTAFGLFAAVVAGSGIGYNLHQAESDLGPLESALRDALGASVGEPSGAAQRAGRPLAERA